MSFYNVISTCARALIKVGAKAITSFSDGTAEAEVAFHLYDSSRDALLSSHPWSFATTQKKLSRLVKKPYADFEYAYQLPRDFLRAISAGTGRRGQGILYRITENQLHTNAKEVMLTYIFRAEEDDFPPFFTDLLVSKLAAEFCLPLTESATRAEFLNKAFDSAFQKAKLIDAQQDFPTTITDFPLISARS
ncbi:MAG: hypothetical protein J6U64_03280 [Alphaproteobacteria bacterium]|nr:hypothetical protein [Alphaproteobacteria bacterium]